MPSKGLEIAPRGWVITSAVARDADSRDLARLPSKGLEIALRGWVITTQAPHDGRPVIAPCGGLGAVARDADSREQGS